MRITVIARLIVAASACCSVWAGPILTFGIHRNYDVQLPQHLASNPGLSADLMTEFPQDNLALAGKLVGYFSQTSPGKLVVWAPLVDPTATEMNLPEEAPDISYALPSVLITPGFVENPNAFVTGTGTPGSQAPAPRGGNNGTAVVTGSPVVTLSTAPGDGPVLTGNSTFPPQNTIQPVFSVNKPASVPEPGTAALLTGGLVMLIAHRRRKALAR